jgi:hypothetical protein
MSTETETGLTIEYASQNTPQGRAWAVIMTKTRTTIEGGVPVLSNTARGMIASGITPLPKPANDREE